MFVFWLKRYSICTPHFNKKYEPLVFSGGGENVSAPQILEPRWYRKSFVLPAGWAPRPAPGSGGSVWAEFDGVFHACVVYLNGAVRLSTCSLHGRSNPLGPTRTTIAV